MNANTLDDIKYKSARAESQGDRSLSVDDHQGFLNKQKRFPFERKGLTSHNVEFLKRLLKGVKKVRSAAHRRIWKHVKQIIIAFCIFHAQVISRNAL